MQSTRAIALARLLLFVLAAFPASAWAQKTVIAEWETLRPEGEEFTILIPKNSTSETAKEPYHKMMLNTRLYLWTNSTGPVFAVVSLSGIKANPALYSEMERLNSYTDAFKHWFPKRVRGKEAIAKLVLVGHKTLNGHGGREYKLMIGDLSGVAHVYATRRRFYAVVYLNNQKDDAIEKQFFTSFVLPEKVLEPPPTVAAQRPDTKRAAELSDSYPVAGQPGDQVKKPETAAEQTESKPVEDPAKVAGSPGQKAPISGGVLNGKAVSLPRPDYPAEARAAKAGGTVTVQVTIDEYGNVATARAISGHPLLQQVSVNAALQAKFAPTFLMGEPVKVTGVITFNFVAP